MALGQAARVADDRGNCICPPTAYPIGGGCALGALIYSLAFGNAMLVLAFLLFSYYRYRKRLRDQAWKIKREELVFDSPVKILGLLVSPPSLPPLVVFPCGVCGRAGRARARAGRAGF